MECQRVSIKIKSLRLPGVQINVVCISSSSFSAALSRLGAGYTVGALLGLCWMPEMPLKRSDCYEYISSGAGLFCRSDLDHRCSKLQTCVVIAELIRQGRVQTGYADFF